MRVRGGLPSGGKTQLFRGNIQLYTLPGGAWVAGKWPRKRPGPGTPNQQWVREQWKEAVSQWSKAMPLDQIAAIALSKGTPLLPRDIVELAMYGKLLMWTDKAGNQYVGVRDLPGSAQQLLDAITNIPGSILVRSADQWIGLVAGPLNYGLTSAGPGNAPYWAPPSGGGSGQTYEATWTAPAVADFPSIEGGVSPQVDLFAHGVRLSDVYQNDGNDHTSLALASVPSPGATGWKAVARIVGEPGPWNYHATGLAIFDSVSGRFEVVRSNQHDMSLAVEYWNGINSFASTPEIVTLEGADMWYQVREEGGVRYWSVSFDGYDFIDFYSATISGDWISTPTGIGIYLDLNRNTGPSVLVGQRSGLKCVSWAASGY